MNRWRSIFVLINLIPITIQGQLTRDPQFKAIPLGDSSLLLKWRSISESKSDILLHDITVHEITPEGEKQSTHKLIKGHIDEYSTRLAGLQPDTKYKIYIEVRGKYVDKALKYSLEARTNKNIIGPPAKPDFEYDVISNPNGYPSVKITWLPCGKQNNCNNATPGGYFYVKYETKGVNTYIVKQGRDADFVHLNKCSPSKLYIVRVVSVNRYNETESDPTEIILPKIIDHEIVEAVNGNDVIVPCRIAEESKGSVNWTVNSHKSDNPRLKQLPNGDLQIKEAERYDRGQYKCSVTTGKSTVKEWVVHVDVKERTVIMGADQRKFEMKLGDSFHRNCLPVVDSSLSVSTNWFKNGQKIDFKPNGRIKTGTWNGIEIPKLTKDDTGNYSCVATTRLDSVKYDFSLLVV